MKATCDRSGDANATNCPVHTHHLSRRIYVASSWRNDFHSAVIEVLVAAGFEVYDFKNPPNGAGFGWEQVALKPWTATPDKGRVSAPKDGVVEADRYLAALEHPRAVEGFNADFEAMDNWADTIVLVLPCGRSAHLELGWAVGAGKRTAVLLDDPCTPELMYKMVDHLSTSVFDLLGWLGVKD